jgi:hypothetical protein
MVSQAKLMQLAAKRHGYETSHVLHLLLSLVTVGIWVPVWLIVAMSNKIERAKIDRKMGELG